MPFEIIFRSWIALAAGLIAAGWGLSFAGHLGWMPVVALVWFFAVAGAAARAGRGMWGTAWRELRPSLLFWPFLLLLGLICLVAALYPPTVHDSLSYRLPRILIWLQNGEISHVPAADNRLNYMPHNWELVALPLFRLTGDSLLEAQNILSWILLYFVGLSWAGRFCPNPSLHRWLAVIGCAAYLPVLQACRSSNDLFAIVFVLLAAWFFLWARDRSSPWDLIWSGLALSLAAGTKPHYAVLAPIWILGTLFFFPWRKHFGTLFLAGAVVTPLILVTSPLPAFLLNQATYDSPMGPVEDSKLSAGSPQERMAAGIVMTVAGNLQPPLNPMARKMESWVDGKARAAGIKERLPKFGFGQTEIPLVDGAGLGIFASLAWLLGITVAIRWRKESPASIWFLAGAGSAGFLIASSQVLPGSIARSFLGMIYLGLPLVFFGLGMARPVWVKGLAALTALSAALVISITPSNPLWPASTVAEWMETNRPDSPLSSLVSRYSMFAERYTSGKSLAAQVPPGEPILAVMGGGEPLLQLWQPYRVPRRVQFLPRGNVLPPDLVAEYIICGGISDQGHRPLLAELEQNTNRFLLVDTRDYVSRLQNGPRPWRLYRIRSNP